MAKTKETEPALFDAEDSVDDGAGRSQPVRRDKSKRDVAKVEQLPPTNLMGVIARVASDTNVDPAKMRELLAFYRDTEARQQFYDAKVAMDAELPIINRDGKIVLRAGKPLRFASFENINHVIKPILRKHGFDLSFQSIIPPSGQGVVIRCVLTRGLYFDESFVPVPATSASPAMNAQQSVGAAFSYAKRYGIVGLLNLETLAPEDRDTDTQPAAEVKTLNGSQAKKALKAINDNNVPQELIKQHYFEPNDITRIDDLPVDQFDRFLASCDNYGKRNK